MGVIEQRRVVRRLLAERFGGNVRIDAGAGLTVSRRSMVIRYGVIEGPSSAPTSVVVKMAVPTEGMVYDPDQPKSIASDLLNEWAGLRFLTEVIGDDSPAPRLWAGDREHGVIVVEDLGSSWRLDQRLMGNDRSPAEEMLSRYAATLGRLHALTIGARAEFERIRMELGPWKRESFAWLPERFEAMASALDLPLSPNVRHELTGLTARMTEPGPFLAYLHRDPCPDNCIETASGMKLIDFEYGGYGHALLDGVYGRMHFPTCWCFSRLPDGVPAAMEQAYRRELIAGCPEAADDDMFRRAVVDASATQLIDWHDVAAQLDADQQWGLATKRQRILFRFDLFARMTRESAHLESIGEVVAAAAARLRALWPSAAEDLRHYPAFTGAPHHHPHHVESHDQPAL